MNRTFAAGLAAVLMLGVSACSEDEPVPRIAEPTGTPSSPPTGDETPEPDEVAPEEAIEGWISGWNQLNRTGAGASIRGWSAAGCGSCEDLVDPISEVYDNGGRVETTGWLVEKIERSRDFAEDSFVYAAIDSSTGTTIASADSPPVQFEAEKIILEFTLVRRDQSWRVKRVAYL